MIVLQEFIHEAPHIFMSVFQALAPLAAVFLIFQFTVLKLRKRAFLRICVGLIYTFVGLWLFLLGIEVGFLPAGTALGELLAAKSWVLLIVVGMILGFVVVMAEPAVQVLNDQVAAVSGGSINKNAMLYSLAIGVAVAVGMSMVRIIFGFSIWWYLIPGYAIAFLLMKITPNVFTAIAFDSGGVASGPMSATFILPFALGASASLGGNVMASAFGTVAMIAMTPLIAVQVMGVIYGRKTKGMEEDYDEFQLAIENSGDDIELFDDDDIEIFADDDIDDDIELFENDITESEFSHKEEGDE